MGCLTTPRGVAILLAACLLSHVDIVASSATRRRRAIFEVPDNELLAPPITGVSLGPEYACGILANRSGVCWGKRKSGDNAEDESERLEPNEDAKYYITQQDKYDSEGKSLRARQWKVLTRAGSLVTVVPCCSNCRQERTPRAGSSSTGRVYVRDMFLLKPQIN